MTIDELRRKRRSLKAKLSRRLAARDLANFEIRTLTRELQHVEEDLEHGKQPLSTSQVAKKEDSR